jgi:inhibitor of cysteine peptidase
MIHELFIGANLPEGHVRDVQNGSVLDVAVGDVIDLHLTENPSTGYRWEIDGIDQNIIHVRERAFRPAAVTDVGGGGTRAFEFAVLGGGETVLRLKHWRDWEGEKSVTERFTVTIRAHE